MRTPGKLAGKALATAGALAALVVLLFPLYAVVIASFENNGQLIASSHYNFFPPSWTLSNYRSVLSAQGGHVLSSLIIALGTAVLTLAISLPAAHALSRYRFRVTGLLVGGLLIAQILPSIVIANSLFVLYHHLHLLNSYPGLILADASYAVPFSILVLRAFMLSLPRDVLAACRCDGAGEWQAFVRVVLPMSRSAIITVAVFAFLQGWSDFIFALTLLSGGTFEPVTLSIYTYVGEFATSWGEAMALATFAVLPAAMLLIAAQRYIAAGLTVGSVKGLPVKGFSIKGLPSKDYRRHPMRITRALAIAGAAVLTVTAAACSGGSGSSGVGPGGKVTITEFDYFTTGGGSQAITQFNKQFMKTHPKITVKRTDVPYADLITKILQDASAGDMPNLMMIDNPDVPEVAETGQLVPLDGMPGYTTKGYTPGAIGECTYQGKHYCYPMGTNTVGMFYNKAMLAAAHVSPPKTWAQLQADAKKLTTSSHYGIAFDATNDEQSTWQLEPFAWSNGGKLSDVDTPQFEQALQLWVNMVKDGSASKSVLSWGQDPDLTQQFLHKKAAMIEDGPWIFPELNAAGWKYGKQYGIVPIPVQRPGQKVITPLGGETADIGASGSTAQQQASWQWIKYMQQPSVMKKLTSTAFYLPDKPAVIKQYLKGGPEYTVFAKEIESAEPRTTQYGANYPKVSQAIWTAIQSAITGTSSVPAALRTAQGTISSVPKVSG
ncbi:MAG: extracellular solute-binding protein [Nocardiopsaceae bacterium]|nr:extracellular solute-binding protein [Nocardiopsaceae bacterium]